VRWWGRHSLSGHVIGRFFPWKHYYVYGMRTLEQSFKMADKHAATLSGGSSWLTSFQLLENNNHHRVFPDRAKIVKP